MMPSETYAKEMIEKGYHYCCGIFWQGECLYRLCPVYLEKQSKK